MKISRSCSVTQLRNKLSNSVIVGLDGSAEPGRAKPGWIIADIGSPYEKKKSMYYVPKINAKEDMLLLRSPKCDRRRVLLTASSLRGAHNKQFIYIYFSY